MAAAPLEGVRVLDLTHHVAGPFCTKLLADFGADVIKVERPDGGDPARHMGPFHGDDPHPEKSALFLHLNTNKRSVTLNLKTPTGREVLRRLAARADVVVESFRPGVVARLGLDYPTLERLNPTAVLTSISSFGQSGPFLSLKATDLTLFAMGGAMNVTGAADREPLKLGNNVMLCHAGAVAAYATVLALLSAEEDGQGQHVDVSIYETLMGCRDRRVIYLTGYQYTGETGRRQALGPRLASGVRPCADGYVNLLGAARWFPNVCRMLGREDLVHDPRFATPERRATPEAAEAFEEYYLPWLMERTMRQVVALAQQHHILSAPIYTTEDLLRDPHFQERGVWEEIDHPYTGPAVYPGRPFIMGATPRPPARRAPLLGEHTAEVLGELGYRREDLALLREHGVI